MRNSDTPRSNEAHEQVRFVESPVFDFVRLDFAREIERELNEARPAWTHEKPTAPGFYWYRAAANERPVVVELGADGFLEWIASDYSSYPADAPGEFAGPIVPPP